MAPIGWNFCRWRRCQGGHATLFSRSQSLAAHRGPRRRLHAAQGRGQLQRIQPILLCRQNPRRRKTTCHRSWGATRRQPGTSSQSQNQYFYPNRIM